MASRDDLNFILKRVSRSFYISMHYLPKAMRMPIALGYLWARLTDTLADAGAVDLKDRLDLLSAVQKTTQHASWDVSEWRVSAEKIAATLQHEGEKQLLMDVQTLQEVTCQLDPAYQTMIRVVMKHILEGQRSDVTFFESSTKPKAMNESQLDLYCYQVAGSVGEFWTDVGFQSCEGFSRQPMAQMKQAGQMYGQGLQLVNILRDFSKDQLLGRCYLPIASSAGLLAQERVYQQWIQTAQSHLQKGLWYAGQVGPWRVRSSTVLPALIGLKTLEQLAANPNISMQNPQKISRRQVRRSMLRSLFYPLDAS